MGCVAKTGKGLLRVVFVLTDRHRSMNSKQAFKCHHFAPDIILWHEQLAAWREQTTDSCQLQRLQQRSFLFALSPTFIKLIDI